MDKKQKKWIDARFNKASVSAMTKSEFVNIYKGQLPLQIDINELAKYLEVKPDIAKSYSSKTTLESPLTKRKDKE